VRSRSGSTSGPRVTSNSATCQDAARQLLRFLPHPGDPPPTKLWGRHVPSVTEFFVGRDVLLARLAGHPGRRGSVLTQSVAGLGGVDKTTVAAAWCHEQAEAVDVVWWLRAGTETTVVADLADLAVELGVADAAGGDLVAAADAACRALEGEGRRWLLVFDNAESDTLVHRFTPRRGDGRVVVTTRRRSFHRLGPVVDVDVFDPATAESFLRARVADANPTAATETQARLVARAIPLLEQAANLRLQIHGADHPDTLASRNNLAAAYRAAGRTADAVALRQANLADQERIFGPDYPYSLARRNNLAAAYCAAGRTADAPAAEPGSQNDPSV
jgi:hypothetical protein